VKRVLAGSVLLSLVTLNGCVVASTSSNDGGGSGFFFLLLPLVFFVAVFAMTRGGRGRRRHTAREIEVGGGSEGINPQLMKAELSVLADDVVRLEPQVALKEEARGDYEAALHRYRVANTALDHTDAPVDLVRVQRVVDEATYSMSRARAILEGRQPPEPPVTLQHRGSRGEPALRLDDSAQPVYEGSPASFRSGWFVGGGGLIGGLLMGSMMGGFGGWVEEGGDESDPDGGTSDW
jgi:hypothetical protein